MPTASKLHRHLSLIDATDFDAKGKRGPGADQIVSPREVSLLWRVFSVGLLESIKRFIEKEKNRIRTTVNIFFRLRTKHRARKEADLRAPTQLMVSWEGQKTDHAVRMHDATCRHGDAVSRPSAGTLLSAGLLPPARVQHGSVGSTGLGSQALEAAFGAEGLPTCASSGTPYSSVFRKIWCLRVLPTFLKFVCSPAPPDSQAKTLEFSIG